MASKKAKAPVRDDLDELGDLLSETKIKKSTKPKPKPKTAASKAMADQDILADLESELSEKPPSRPHTPQLRDNPPKGSPVAKRSAPAAAAPTSAKTDPRKSTDSASATSSESQESDKRAPAEQPAAQSGGGWWGGILSTASAAMKQAEAAVSQIQHSEEAKKWTEQVRGNVGALRGLGDELRTRAMPTFSNILQTIAPPISQHERLRIHITHDMVGYPSLDPLIYSVFSRVMSQVEGGDLMVIQRGHEATARRASDSAFFTGSSAAGWRDGPWWRAADVPRDMGIVSGLTEGTKLCRVSAEDYSREFFAANGGVEAAKQRAVEPVSESNPVRSSDLFLAVQAIATDADEDLFASSAAAKKEEEDSPAHDDKTDPMVCFAIYVLDPVHEIVFSTVSHELPARWIQWLDAQVPITPGSDDEEGTRFGVPEEIQEIIESGGVDPREWVSEWVEEAISLAVGVVAQRYVARRMGVGEGGIGKGKQRADVIIQEGGGEAARAGLI